MTCPSCRAAEADPRSAEFSHLCASCEGRAAAALGFDEAQACHTLRQISADPGQSLAHWRRWAAAIKRHDSMKPAAVWNR